MEKFDLIVIGGGSGGLTATTIAARLGARVLLVDRERLGGDCLHDGCVPSKALIASARLAHQMRRAAEFGLATVDVAVDFGAVLQRIRRIQDDIGRHETPEEVQRQGAEVRLGGARFVDPHTIEIGGAARVEADRFIIATGSRAVAPPIPGLRESGYIDHVSLFRMTALPRRLAVIGGGPIGVEMGQALARLGARVTILQRPAQLIEREDAEVAAVLAETLRHEGVDVRLGASVERVERRGADKLVIVGSASEPIAVDEVLVAIGRAPVLDALDLPRAGVETSKRGIVVDDHLRTSQRHIYAVGDCAGGPQFTHWAEYEARVATRNALFRGSSRRSKRVIPWVTFTDPEVARVGLTEREAREQGHDAHVHRFDFSRVDRAVTESETSGFIKVVADRRERVLGAHIVGSGAGEALAEWVLALEHPRTLRLGDIAGAIHAYPTISRINRRVADGVFLDHGISPWLVRLAGRWRRR